MLAVLWITATGEQSAFPRLLKGDLTIVEAGERISVRLTDVKNHTWENLLKKPQPVGESKKILWEPHDDVAYDNVRLDKIGERNIHCSTEDGSERICIELLPE